jgi:HEPN domain-containing protein
MDRDELHRLATERIADAKALLSLKRWAAAYYLAGYAVECGLKACVLVRLTAEPEIVFDERRYSEKCWTHDLDQLVNLAGLRAALDADIAADKELSDFWDVVREWNEESRYERASKADALALYAAITNKGHGVFPWIKARW